MDTQLAVNQSKYTHPTLRGLFAVSSLTRMLRCMHSLEMFVVLLIGAYRARVQPLRQEPEWQLNDIDVQEACRQVDS